MKNSTPRPSLWTLCITLLVLVFGAAPSRAQDFEKVANDLATRIHAAKHSRVTVVDFVDLDSKPTSLGRHLAQLLQSSLAEPKHKLVVVDQSQLSHLMDQIEKLNEGLLDPATGQKLGQMAGTEVIIRGRVMPSSMTIRVDISAVDLQTAKIITGATAKVARLPSYERMLAERSPGVEPKIASPMPQSAAQAQSASRGPARTHHDQGITFDLEGCSLSGAGLRCAFIVTSERDSWLAIGFRSRAWNEEGEEYQPGEVTIANTRSTGGCAEKQVLKNVQTRLLLTFPGFSDDVESVERLRLGWNDENNCYGLRFFDVEKIAISADTDFGSVASRLGRGEKGAAEEGGKRNGGLMQRIGGRIVNAAEEAAAKVIDKKTREVTGEDEEEEEEKNDPPKDR